MEIKSTDNLNTIISKCSVKSKLSKYAPLFWMSPIIIAIIYFGCKWVEFALNCCN